MVFCFCLEKGGSGARAPKETNLGEKKKRQRMVADNTAGMSYRGHVKHA
jgi:hypothetical protein